MKKLLLIVAATLVCVSAFAQGKLSFANDSTRVAYFTTDLAKLMPGDADVAKAALTAANITSLDGAPTLKVELWGGATPGNLSLQTSSTTWLTAGRWTAINATFATLPASVAASFQIRIYDSRATSPEDAWSKIGWYAGQTPVFTAVPQPSSYNPIYQSASPVLSTWAAGTVGGLVGSTGLGAIEVYATVPEPGTFALAGLGLATLLIFRRRK